MQYKSLRLLEHEGMPLMVTRERPRGPGPRGDRAPATSVTGLLLFLVGKSAYDPPPSQRGRPAGAPGSPLRLSDLRGIAASR